MMTTKSHKRLWGKWIRERNKAVRDKSDYTTAEQEDLDITGQEGTNLYQKEAYKMPTQPVDPNTNQHKEAIDIRKLPEMGGE